MTNVYVRVLALLMAAAAGLATLSRGAHADSPHAWSGIYVGGNIGGAWTGARWSDVSLTAESTKFSDSGFLGGGQIGAQYQFGRFVAGVEVSYSGLDSDARFVSIANPAVTYATRQSDLFTAAGRLGVSFENYLIYAKGGYASVETEYKGEFTGVDSFKTSKRNNGYVVGGGVEYMIDRHLIFGLEYNHIELGDRDVSGTTATLNFPYAITRANSDIDTFVARLSYKFGGPDPRR